MPPVRVCEQPLHRVCPHGSAVGARADGGSSYSSRHTEHSGRCILSVGAKNAPSEYLKGKIAKVEGPQISFAEVEGLGTGTAVNGPIVAVALASY